MNGKYVVEKIKFHCDSQGLSMCDMYKSCGFETQTLIENQARYSSNSRQVRNHRLLFGHNGEQSSRRGFPSIHFNF